MKKRFSAVSLSLIFALAVIVFPFSASNVEAKGVSGTIKINNETYKYIEESFGKTGALHSIQVITRIQYLQIHTIILNIIKTSSVLCRDCKWR